MCTGAEIAGLALSAAGTGASAISRNDALRKQDQEAAAGILRQAEFSRQAQGKVAKNIQQLEQSNPQDDIAKRQTVYLDALRRSQPTVSKALPGATGGSTRFAEDTDAAQTAGNAEAGTNANLMARIDAPGIQRTREAAAANDTLSQLSMLGDQSSHADYLARLRMSMQRPNALLSGVGQLAQGYGSAKAINGAYDDSNAWDDGSASSGLTAQQRRQRAVSGG